MTGAAWSKVGLTGGGLSGLVLRYVRGWTLVPLLGLTPLDMADASPTDPALRQRIEDTLDSIRPYLMADGGSVRLQDVTDEFVVELELLGACGTCPMSMMTLRAGIEQAIRRAVPEVTRVEAVAPSAA